MRRSAVEEVLDHWKPRIKMLIARFGNSIIDKDLLYNELLEKVYECIKKYDSSYGAEFDTFAFECCVNHIHGEITKEKRKGRIHMNTATSLNALIADHNIEILDTLKDQSIESEDDIIFGIIIHKIEKALPKDIKIIFSMKIDGKTTQEIAATIREPTIYVQRIVDELLKPLLAKELNIDYKPDPIANKS